MLTKQVDVYYDLKPGTVQVETTAIYCYCYEYKITSHEWGLDR